MTVLLAARPGGPPGDRRSRRPVRAGAVGPTRAAAATVATGAGVAVAVWPVGCCRWRWPWSPPSSCWLRPLGVSAGARAAAGRRGLATLWGFALPRAASAAIDASSMWVGRAAHLGAGRAGRRRCVRRGRPVRPGRAAGHAGAAGGGRAAAVPAAGAGRPGRRGGRHRQVTSWILLLSWPAYLLLAVFAPGVPQSLRRRVHRRRHPRWRCWPWRCWSTPGWASCRRCC